MLENARLRKVYVPHPDTGESVLVTHEKVREHAEADHRVLEAAERYSARQARWLGRLLRALRPYGDDSTTSTATRPDEVTAANSLARLSTGDRVRIGHGVRPGYFHGLPATVIRRGTHTITIQLDRPVGKFVDGCIRCFPLAVEKIGT